MSDPAQDDADLARLETENDALDAQVKLLVRTEQRLYRTKASLDRQLDRIRALSDFALRTMGAEDPTEILGRALALIQEQFDVEQACAARVTHSPDKFLLVTHHNGATVHAVAGDATPELLARLKAAVGLPLLNLAAPAEAARARPILEALGLELPTPAGGVMACLVLQNRAGRPVACLVAHGAPSLQTAICRDRLGEAHLPYLLLLANHVQSALQSAELTTRLRDGSRQLAYANARLTESLTTLEQAQEQLLQAQKMEAVGRLAGGVAHDFNNLLTVILSHARFLEMDLAEGTESHADAVAISEAGERAVRLTNQLLAFSRKQKRSPQVVDVNVLVSHSAQMLSRLIGEHISLEVRTQAEISCVRADPGQLEQIVLNLVVNSRDAMPLGGRLTLETRSDHRAGGKARGGRVALIVSDTGQGMDPEILAQIFEPFFTTKAPGQGTGMGLATVYGLVQQNEATIEVSSEVGQGSTFTIWLPAVEGVPTPRALPIARRSGNQAATILLVEDEASIRDAAARVLRSAGYSVVEASDGERALVVWRQLPTPADLVVSDVVMPRLGGVGLAQQLRAWHPETRVLFMSGYTFEAPDLTDLDSVLEKPFTPDTLLERVRDALAFESGPPDEHRLTIS